MTNVPIKPADSDWTHPIPKDIVADVADEHEIDERLLHALLEEGRIAWDGHRDDLLRIMDSVHGSVSYDLMMVHADEYLIAWGYEFHPKHLLRDIHLSDYMGRFKPTASPLRLLIAVTQAHRQFAEQLRGTFQEGWTPVVVRDPREQ